MDRTTWRDEKVVAWLAANAIAVQLDVDEEQDLAAKLNIEAMPTVIALKEGGPEFDRIIGYRRPAEFLTWAEAIARGFCIIPIPYPGFPSVTRGCSLIALPGQSQRIDP